MRCRQSTFCEEDEVKFVKCFTLEVSRPEAKSNKIRTIDLHTGSRKNPNFKFDPVCILFSELYACNYLSFDILLTS